MSEQEHTIAKLEAFLEVLDDLISETLAAGVSDGALRRTLLASAVREFMAQPSDGIAALDHLRKALEMELVRSSGQFAG